MPWTPGFVALLAPGADDPRLPKVRAALAAHASDLVLRFEADGLAIYGRASQPFFANRGRSLVILGPVFERDGSRASLDTESLEPVDFADLLARCWGRYLVFRRAGRSKDWAVLRDPSGAIGALLANGLIGLVADELPRWLLEALGIVARPDRRRVANALATPAITAHRSLLTGVEILPAGAAATWTGTWSEPQLLWSAPNLHPQRDADPASIREAVLAVGRAIAAERRNMVIELSGGLDSAVTLGAVRAADMRSQIIAVNIATRQVSGDERGPARDAAAHYGIELVEVAAHESQLDYRLALNGQQPAVRNGYGLDSVLETAVCGICRAFGADMILTGQGGDAAFFQFPTDQLAVDLYRGRGICALWSTQAMDVARRGRMSIWRLQWRMATHRWRRTVLDTIPPTLEFLTAAARRELDPSFGAHPWVAAARHLPPAKRFQVFALANGQWFNTPAARRQTAELVHPLLAQPVMEACLAMPSYRLSFGIQDRALARALFADLLPTSILRRRSKGETSAYYRRAIVHNLPFLREHLLGGCLVAAGLLEPAKLDTALDEDALLWRHDVNGLLSLASIESWARHWSL